MRSCLCFPAQHGKVWVDEAASGAVPRVQSLYPTQGGNTRCSQIVSPNCWVFKGIVSRPWSPKPYRIEFYKTVSGKTPFKRWLVSLKDIRARANILARLERLEDGNPGNVKPVGEGVMEIKIDFGPGYRLYFGRDGPILILLLCGGDKATQRAAPRRTGPNHAVA